MRRDAKEIALLQEDFAAIDGELQGPGMRVRDLLIEMAMHGHYASLLQKNARDHNLVADEKLPIKERIDGFYGDLVPTRVLYLGL